MAHFYTLQSCDSLSYPDIIDLAYGNANHAFTNKIVYVNQLFDLDGDNIDDAIDPYKTYQLVYNGVDTEVLSRWLPKLKRTNLDTCADAIADRMYEVVNCNDDSDTRNVLLPITYTLGTVLVFTGECVCYKVNKNISSYDESLTVDSSYSDCTTCLEAVVEGLCDYEQRTIGYAVGVSLPKGEPVDRGFNECCYTQLALADLSDTDPYKNDFTSVFYKRQTPNDTISYEIIPQSTGVPVTLVDGTHGTLYAFGSTEQPDLSYFIVDWRKILSTIGEDVFYIRKVLSIAGQAYNVDTLINYNLKSFTQQLADDTVRIDCKLDGKIVKIDTDFKDSGYENSIRLDGYFGDRKPNYEQDNVVFSSKKGQPYFEDNITMSNDWEYTLQAYNVPECQTRTLYDEILWGNELFISDYNLNNHSYLYELQPVILADASELEYQVRSRKANLTLSFRDRTKDNRKTNC